MFSKNSLLIIHSLVQKVQISPYQQDAEGALSQTKTLISELENGIRLIDQYGPVVAVPLSHIKKESEDKPTPVEKSTTPEKPEHDTTPATHQI